jgi:hypothetical protein
MRYDQTDPVASLVTDLENMTQNFGMHFSKLGTARVWWQIRFED